MLRRLYEWTLALAAKKAAVYWLAFIAFVESSVFLVPADVLFIPMAIAKPGRAYLYAAIATIFSVLGGILGWMIGHYAFEAIARPVLAFYGKLDTFQALAQAMDYKTVVLLLVTSGLTHLPPIKVVTILSGFANVSLAVFIASAIVTRGIRFFALAWLLQKYGEDVRHFVEKQMKWVAVACAAAVLVLYGTYTLLR
jgi:membrane protein YqaA with SNARE-associated domain